MSCISNNCLSKNNVFFDPKDLKIQKKIDTIIAISLLLTGLLFLVTTAILFAAFPLTSSHIAFGSILVIGTLILSIIGLYLFAPKYCGLKHIQKSLEQDNETIQTLQKELASAYKETQDLKNQLVDLTLEIQKKELAKETLGNQIKQSITTMKQDYDLKKQLAHQNNQLGILQDQLSLSRKTQKQLQEQIVILTKKITNKNQKIDNLNQQLQSLKSECNTLEKTNVTLESQLEIACTAKDTLSNDLSILQNKDAQLELDNEQLKKKIVTLENTAISNQRTILALEEEKKSQNTEITQLLKELANSNQNP